MPKIIVSKLATYLLTYRSQSGNVQSIEKQQRRWDAMLVNGQTPEKRADYNRQYKAIPENMAKIRARAVLRNALRVGTMVRQPCRQCGAEKTHGHHEDYSKPLDVCWLCHTCHVAEHRKTHCKRGHALTADNIYVVRSKRPYRKCRQCQREQYQQFKISRIA